jgi:flagellar hook protein FlgE
MSIFGAMLSGVTGLGAQTQALAIIADNISNVNTIGYKGSQSQFSTLVTRAATVNTYTPGGVQFRPIQGIDKQGLLQSSSSKTDIAIAGQGFFIVNEAASPTLGNDYFFTRAGSFKPDQNGNLVNTAGYYLQGWPLTNGTTLPTNISTLTGVQTINVAGLVGAATATQNVTLGLNLPSTAAVSDSFSTAVQIFDSLGNAHDIELQFTKTAVNSWSITVQDPVLASTGAASGTVTPVARSITFNGDGTPNTITFPDIDITGWTTGAFNSTATFDVGTANQNDGVTQLAGEFSITSIDQDGARFGGLVGVTISEDGTVTAVFDNGEQLPISKLPIALFANLNGLDAVSGNAYRQTGRSGNLLLQQANVGGAGSVASSALESSTVDLAEEFTKMIITQRAYSASAKIITTADEMLEELIRMRR